MPGTVNWIATFERSVDSPVKAELYDADGNVVAGDWVPCEPPVACPFATEDIPFGTYTAALVFSGNRYYYDENKDVITVPNDIVHATPVVFSQSNPEVDIEISASA